MKTRLHDPCWTLSLLILLTVHVLSVVCYFERGERYWSGRPQPIGIDFSSAQAVTVYADGPDNFTTLAIVRPNPGNDYARYLNVLHQERHIWDGFSTIANDDDQFVLEESKIAIWADNLLSPVRDLVDWSRSFKIVLCDSLYPRLYHFPGVENFCYPDDEYEYRPIKPKSRYQKLLVERRMDRLRAIMPKWFRTPQHTQLSRSGFVLSIFEILEEMKQAAYQSGIVIKSASISKPGWVYNEWSDLIDEACLLANIEVYEQPTDRFEAAAKTAQEGGSVVVLDHGINQFDIAYGEWNEHAQAHPQRQSMSLEDMGTSWMYREMAFHVLNTYNENANVSMEERPWALDIGLTEVALEVAKARDQVQFDTDFPKSADMIGKDTTVNLTEPSGRVRTLNVTSQDILEVEERYIDAISENVQAFLRGTNLFLAFKNPLRDGEEKHVDGAPHLPNEDSSQNTITPFDVIILDTGRDFDVLRRAVDSALAKLQLNMTQRDNGVCYPYYAIAAQGASLRAREWISYYDASFPEIQEEEEEEDYYYDDQWQFDIAE